MTDRKDDPMIEIRTAARLILLDESRRLLLFRHVDGHGREFWATPGGGVEPGESLEAAARREAAEELGATTVELIALWSGHSEFIFAGRNVSQSETFFLITTHSEILGSAVQELHRREGIVEVRWWSVAEIRNSDEPIFPVDLANRLSEHLEGAKNSA
jgi:ADP-ribose pyrophosphatase YjhB (NUDIX family)